MAQAKRARTVSLTKVQKKGEERRDALVETVQSNASIFSMAYIVQVDNMRTDLMQLLRNAFRAPNGDYTGRFVQGALKPMIHALLPEGEELRPGARALTQALTSSSSLLFTDKTPADVAEILASVTGECFAREGGLATQTITIPAGDSEIPGSLELQVRNLGAPTKLWDGKVVFLHDYTVCTEGEKMTATQAQFVKILGVRMAVFKCKATHALYNDGNLETLE